MGAPPHPDICRLFGKLDGLEIRHAEASSWGDAGRRNCCGWTRPCCDSELRFLRDLFSPVVGIDQRGVAARTIARSFEHPVLGAFQPFRRHNRNLRSGSIPAVHSLIRAGVKCQIRTTSMRSGSGWSPRDARRRRTRKRRRKRLKRFILETAADAEPIEIVEMRPTAPHSLNLAETLYRSIAYMQIW
jgi:hypothetical protein